MPTNPYAPPAAQVADPTVMQRGQYVPGGRGAPSGHGWNWIVEGWTLFKRAPGMWIAIIVTFAVIYFVVALVPLVGSLATFLFGPVFGAGLMIGCRVIEEGGELEFKHLFEGFSNRLGPLVAVGALYLAAWIGIVLVAALVGGVGVFALFLGGGGQDAAAMAAALTTIVLVGLIVLALSIPVVMAVWFAPALVVFHELGPVEAMKDSFLGCLRNVLPFLVYGIMFTLLAILATIPLGLGWLVLGPVTVASIYTAYRDIYLS
jgi:uncharacterized membrane protein